MGFWFWALHPTAQVTTALLPDYNPDHVAGKAAEDGPSSQTPIWETWIMFLAPGFGARPGWWGYWVSRLVNGRPLFLSLPVSLSHCLSNQSFLILKRHTWFTKDSSLEKTNATPQARDSGQVTLSGYQFPLQREHVPSSPLPSLGSAAESFPDWWLGIDFFYIF